MFKHVVHMGIHWYIQQLDKLNWCLYEWCYFRSGFQMNWSFWGIPKCFQGTCYDFRIDRVLSYLRWVQSPQRWTTWMITLLPFWRLVPWGYSTCWSTIPRNSSPVRNTGIILLRYREQLERDVSLQNVYKQYIKWAMVKECQGFVIEEAAFVCTLGMYSYPKTFGDRSRKCKNVPRYMFVYVHVCTYLYVSRYLYVYTCVCVCAYVCINVYACISGCTHSTVLECNAVDWNIVLWYEVQCPVIWCDGVTM